MISNQESQLVHDEGTWNGGEKGKSLGKYRRNGGNLVKILPSTSLKADIFYGKKIYRRISKSFRL